MSYTFVCNGRRVRIEPVKSKYGIGKFKYYTANVYEDNKLVLCTDQLENDPDLAVHNAEVEYLEDKRGYTCYQEGG